MLMPVRESKNHEKEKSQGKYIVEDRSNHQHPSLNLKKNQKGIFFLEKYTEIGRVETI